MKKYLISVLVLLVIMTSVQISSAAIALNITSDHYINISGMKVYPIGLQAICSGSPEEGGWSNTTECLNTLNENKNSFYFDPSNDFWGYYSTFSTLYDTVGLGWTPVAYYQNSTFNISYPIISMSQITGNPTDSMMDEPEWANVTIRSNAIANYNKSKQNYPNTITYMNNWDNLINWLGYVDIFSFDGYANNNYKITNYYDRPFLVYGQEQWNKQFMGGLYWNNSIFNNKSVWNTLATYSSTDDTGIFAMTREEARAMTWNVITSGFQGVMYYGWIPPSATPSPGLWANTTIATWYQGFGYEIRSLNSILVLPTLAISWENEKNYTHPIVTPNNRSVFGKAGGAWEGYQGDNFDYILKGNNSNKYLIIVNKNSTTTGMITINISGYSTASSVATLGNETSGSGATGQTINVIDGVFTDTFDGYAVHIYQIYTVVEPEIITSTYQTCIDGGSGIIRVGIFCDDFTDNNINGWNISNQSGFDNLSVSISTEKLILSGGLGSVSHIHQNISLHQNIRYSSTISIDNYTSYVDAGDFYRSPGSMEFIQYSIGHNNRTHLYSCSDFITCTAINDTSYYNYSLGENLYVVVDILNPTGGIANINGYISNISQTDALSRGVQVSGTTSLHNGSMIEFGGYVFGNVSFDDILIRGLNSDGSELSPYRPNPPTNLVGGCYQNYTCEWGWT
jgi:hypothetical protein